MKRLLSMGVLLAISLTTLHAQQAWLTNAKLETRSAASGLDAGFRSAVNSMNGPLWIGYSVPMVAGEHQMCCWYSDGNGSSRGCGLEGGRASVNGAGSNRVLLEGSRELYVLYRVEGKQVQKIRTFSADCQLDGGGLPVVWFTDVKPADSLQLLSTFAATAEGTREDDRNPGQAAVSAIAFHEGTQAEQMLEQFAMQSKSTGVRRKAIFWLGNMRGRPGYEAIKKVLQSEADDKVREHAVFALTQSKEREAIPTIIEVAKNDRSTHVRSQALFWLSQKAGQQASSAINEAIDRDPDTEVKKKAVFALSQLPKDEGIPMLIRVAKENANPAVRKQAMFWLGQSKDQRAIQFFESVLLK